MKCRICNMVDKSGKIFVFHERMYGTLEPFEYYYCPACESLQIVSLPERLDRFYQIYYTDNFIPSFKKDRLKKPLLVLRTMGYLSFFGKWMEAAGLYNEVLHWCRIAGIGQHSSILDVGCGNGSLLYSFYKYGFKNLTGIDPHLKTEFTCKEICFFRQDIFSMHASFDFIMFNHSFEHIWEQHETLEKASVLLNKGGTIMIRIPVLNYAYSVYGKYWAQLDPPRHLYLHSVKSFTHLVRSHHLEIYHAYCDSTELQFVGSEQNKKGIGLYTSQSYYVDPGRSIFDQRQIRHFKKLAKELNKKQLGDQMVFFLKKAEK